MSIVFNIFFSQHISC